MISACGKQSDLPNENGLVIPSSKQRNTMKKLICGAHIVLFLMIFSVPMLHAGYTVEPWGSKTWTGSERPPHWSPEPDSPRMSEKHHRRHNHHSKRFDSSDYRQPKGDDMVIEREKRIPVYLPAQRKPARQQCGGETITRSDPRTGELIIEYVSRARDC